MSSLVAKEKDQTQMDRKRIETVPTDMLRLSRFNPRKSRQDGDIERLAERIKRNGFEVTRAVWVYESKDGAYEVFAGGTRFMAAVAAGVKMIPVVLHLDHTEEEIVRLADEDNENDEYHAPVPLVDTWAEYYFLHKGEGWPQNKIAEAKRVAKSLVSERCGWHESLPDRIKAAVGSEEECRKSSTKFFGEKHLRALAGLVLPVELSEWMTIDLARDQIVDSLLEAARGKSTGNANITAQNVQARVKEWQKLIADADDGYRSLGNEWGPRFVERLASESVRTLAKLNECFQLVLREKHEAEKKKAAEADKAKSEAEQAAAEAERQAEEAARIEEMTAKIVHGDAIKAIAQMPEASLLLTDPPYGQDFQSGRRKSTGKKKKIEADDDPTEAAGLLRDVLASARDRLKDNAHVLVFSGWRHEPIFRHAVESAGYEIKGSLVWVKNNHGTGDLKGSFAPKHERIIHAVKGRPEMAKRIPDVVEGKDKQNSDHPTEKPIELLKKLIEATTHKLETVVDPFAGSGSTLLAALDLDRDFWGVEIDAEYHKKIQDELYKRATEK